MSDPDQITGDFSQEFKNLVNEMLKKKAGDRPTVDEILEMQIIKDCQGTFS